VRLVALALAALAGWTGSASLAVGLGPPTWRALAGGEPRALAAVAGVGGASVLLLVLRRVARDPVDFCLTLEHEATHALFALLTGGRPVSLRVGPAGEGAVRHAGSRAGAVVALAPYFFPTTTVALVLVALLVPAPRPLALLVLVAASLGYHLASDALEARPLQPDIRHHGGWLALLAVAGSWGCLLLGTVGAIALGGGAAWRAVAEAVTGVVHAIP
jgi:hypothetical protein